MFQLVATVLAWYYGLVHNYAIAIALLTLTIMVLLTPLTLKGTKSMLELQRLQPEIKKLQAEYRGDRQKLNEEMMKLYQEHKINPLGGCLPLLLQAPVFIILFRVLNKLTESCPGPSVPLADQPSRCVADTAMFGMPEPTVVREGNFGASYVDHSTDLWKDLSQGDTMMSFGLDLSKPATEVISDNFVQGIPYLLLVLAVAATSYYQQRQISARNTNTPVNAQQQLIMRLMPAFFAVISLTLPSGLIIYFLTSNLYRIAQQAYITRRFYRNLPDLPAAPPPSKAAAKAKPAPTKPAPSAKAKPGRVTPPKGASPSRPPASSKAKPTPRPRPAPKKKP
jgi:YidC/Oxa1 family membrane protein insertase